MTPLLTETKSHTQTETEQYLSSLKNEDKENELACWQLRLFLEAYLE